MAQLDVQLTLLTPFAANCLRRVPEALDGGWVHPGHGFNVFAHLTSCIRTLTAAITSTNSVCHASRLSTGALHTC